MPMRARRPCTNCGTQHSPTRRGRCKNCDGHLRRHGVERPTRLHSPIPFKCGNCSAVSDKTGMGSNGRSRCVACQEHFWRTGSERPAAVIARSIRIRSGMRVCRVCGSIKPKAGFHKNQHDCKPCQAIAAFNYKQARRARPTSSNCASCGRTFTRSVHASHSRYCSQPCRARGWKRENRAARKLINERHRMGKKGAYVSDVQPRAIFDRDLWMCQLCHGPVRQDLPGHHGRAPTLDHIKPLSKGGTHEPSNVQLAHLSCNAGKREGRGRWAHPDQS